MKCAEYDKARREAMRRIKYQRLYELYLAWVAAGRAVRPK